MAKNPLAHALAQIEFHKSQAMKWEQYASLHKELYGEFEQPTKETSPPRATGPKTGAIAETREAAKLILEEAGEYVQGSELIEKLMALGVEVGGANPGSTLSARLSGDPKIESRRGHGYRLKHLPESEGAAGSSSPDEPAAPLFTPDSADEDGREVAHDNMLD